ncbi:MAG: ABC transporter ATP-binding protein [Candidatus Tectomicrobia bacterium]|nr:ABC transporter ATP-binding protein [Candidatus Tectomicrobia bacterium]
MEFLSVVALSKNFGGLRALHELNLVVREGDVFGIIGPNGSGKTTFFNLVTGMFPATSGDIRFRGEPTNLARLPSHEIAARGISRTFQNQRLFDRMTVLENVLVGMHTRLRSGLLSAALRLPRTRREEQAAKQRALDLLGFFGDRLRPRAEHPAASLSYANRRRLEIARALALQPKLLLLDEPAAGMNPTESRQLMEDVRRIRDGGVTVLLIEHDLSIVAGICDRVAVLDHGEKITEGAFEQVRGEPRVIEAYLGRSARRGGKARERGGGLEAGGGDARTR